ncbi:MAG: hypothetical protein KAJ49_06280 [Arcobacteraceae bacterium]|nr:hypothetical protein [Arcobacteraceae bacterium]
MKVEFRKVPNIAKEFKISLNSVNFLGTFSRISNKLVRIDAQIEGNYPVECCKCGKEFAVNIDEKHIFTVSDGIFSSHDERENEIIIEIDDHIINFEDILNSELESLNSEYHICNDCATSDNFVDIEI